MEWSRFRSRRRARSSPARRAPGHWSGRSRRRSRSLSPRRSRQSPRPRPTSLTSRQAPRTIHSPPLVPGYWTARPVETSRPDATPSPRRTGTSRAPQAAAPESPTGDRPLPSARAKSSLSGRASTRSEKPAPLAPTGVRHPRTVRAGRKCAHVQPSSRAVSVTASWSCVSVITPSLRAR